MPNATANDTQQPSAHDLLQLQVSSGALQTTALLDSGASHNFIAAPQATKFCENSQEHILTHTEPLEVHLADNTIIISK